jgi:hypothetical protein
VLPRASTLAMEAITPSFTSRVMRMSLSVTVPVYCLIAELAGLAELAELGTAI